MVTCMRESEQRKYSWCKGPEWKHGWCVRLTKKRSMWQKVSEVGTVGGDEVIGSQAMQM